MFCDLTEEEEIELPLPNSWIRTFNAVAGNVMYKNLSTGVESEEHPFVLQALNAARKLPLPANWVVKEARLSDGTIDYFYCNPSLGLSNWDPPQLRHCLADCLGKNGYESAAHDILAGVIEPMESHESQSQDSSEEESSSDQSDEIDHGSYGDESQSQVSATAPSFSLATAMEGIDQNRHEHPSEKHSHNVYEESDFQMAASQGANIIEDVGAVFERLELQVDPPEDGDESSQKLQPSPFLVSEDLLFGPRGRSEKWQLVREANKLKSGDTASQGRRGGVLKPPTNSSGVKVLSVDVLEADSRVRELISKVRIKLAKKSGIRSKHIDIAELEEQLEAPGAKIDNIRLLIDLMSMASDLLGTLVQHPEYIVSTMASADPQSLAMVHVAFTFIQRVLHPFCTDQTLTTALLLEAINLQVLFVAAVLLTRSFDQSIVHFKHCTIKHCLMKQISVATN